MYQRILVPIDGGDTSADGVDEAVRLAALTGAELRLMHVVVAADHTNGFESGAVYCAEVLPRMQQAGARLLAAAARRAARCGVTVGTTLAETMTGQIAKRVVSEARAWRADVIVIGSHGRHGVDRFFMGSIAEQLARTAPVPVLIVGVGHRQATAPTLLETADDHGTALAAEAWIERRAIGHEPRAGELDGQERLDRHLRHCDAAICR